MNQKISIWLKIKWILIVVLVICVHKYVVLRSSLGDGNESTLYKVIRYDKQKNGDTEK